MRGRSGGWNRRSPRVAAALLVAAMACGACEEERAPSDRPVERAAGGAATSTVVAVSVPPQAWLVERLAGDLVRVEVMIPPGTSPATHEPTIEQMRAMGRASVYVKVGHPGFPFERAWLDRLLEQAGDVRVVDCAQGIAVDAGDPHVWVSPKRTRAMVPRIAEAIASVLPQGRETIERNRDALLADIDALDAELERELSELPRTRFYVFHAAWGYLARDYGLEQVAIEHGGKEPDPRTLAAIIEKGRLEHVSTVFVQPQFSEASAELVAGEMGARVVTLDPLARDWDDNLRRTADALKEALADG